MVSRTSIRVRTSLAEKPRDAAEVSLSRGAAPPRRTTRRCCC